MVSFEIDICGDCARYPDCKIKDKKKCRFSLNEKELIERLKKWYRGV